MTQTLQQALLKAGLISQEKLKKAEQDKKAAQRAHHQQSRPGHGAPQRPQQARPGPGIPGDYRSQPSQANVAKAATPPPPAATKPALKTDKKSERGPAASDSLRDGGRSSRPDRGDQMRGLGRERDRSPGFIEGKHHHHIRTDCEACGRTSPDVEYYEHRNRSLDKYWLCVKCADDNNILDDFRQTMQSSQSQRGLFQRGYGHTKIFRKKL